MKVFMDRLAYCETTGNFYHLLNNRGSTKVGDKAGSLHSRGYWQLKIGKQAFYAHRVAFYLLYDRWPLEIDHLNRDKLDNRPENLVESDRVSNNHNKGSQRIKNGKWKGTYKRRGKYCATITVNGERKHLGTFLCETAAHFAYLKANKELLSLYQKGSLID